MFFGFPEVVFCPLHSGFFERISVISVTIDYLPAALAKVGIKNRKRGQQSVSDLTTSSNMLSEACPVLVGFRVIN
jgi:hypothetical protein